MNFPTPFSPDAAQFQRDRVNPYKRTETNPEPKRELEAVKRRPAKLVSIPSHIITLDLQPDQTFEDNALVCVDAEGRTVGVQYGAKFVGVHRWTTEWDKYRRWKQVPIAHEGVLSCAIPGATMADFGRMVFAISPNEFTFNREGARVEIGTLLYAGASGQCCSVKFSTPVVVLMPDSPAIE